MRRDATRRDVKWRGAARRGGLPDRTALRQQTGGHRRRCGCHGRGRLGLTRGGANTVVLTASIAKASVCKVSTRFKHMLWGCCFQARSRGRHVKRGAHVEPEVC